MWTEDSVLGVVIFGFMVNYKLIPSVAISFIIVYENSNCNYNVTIKILTAIMLFHIHVNLKVLKQKISQFCVFHKTQN